MRDEPYVRFVDAHAESDGCDHDHGVVTQESFLVFGAGSGVEPRVVGQGVKAPNFEPLGGCRHAFAGQTVDDAGLLPVVFQKFQQLAARIGLGLNRVADVRAIETVDELSGVGQFQACNDVGPRAGIGCGREGNARNTWKCRFQPVELQIILAEIVAPGRHAMGFVNCNQARVTAFERCQRVVLQDPFGRDIQQIEIAALRIRNHLILI